MSAENPIRWIGGAAVVVGAFVAIAVCSSGPPKALDLKVDAHRVAFAENRSQAVAMASQPVAPRPVASKPAPARKQKLAQSPSPQVLVQGTTTVAATTVAPTSAPIAFAVYAKTVTTHRQPAICGAPITDSPGTDVLIAARPLRGPPSV